MHPEHMEQRRFPGSRRPHDGDELAFFDVQIDASKYPGLAGTLLKILFDVAKRDQN
jgi:hypothetical protein